MEDLRPTCVIPVVLMVLVSSVIVLAEKTPDNPRVIMPPAVPLAKTPEISDHTRQLKYQLYANKVSKGPHKYGIHPYDDEELYDEDTPTEELEFDEEAAASWIKSGHMPPILHPMAAVMSGDLTMETHDDPDVQRSESKDEDSDLDDGAEETVEEKPLEDEKFFKSPLAMMLEFMNENYEDNE